MGIVLAQGTEPQPLPWNMIPPHTKTIPQSPHLLPQAGGGNFFCGAKLGCPVKGQAAACRQTASCRMLFPFRARKGNEKGPPFRCGGRRLGLRPQTPRCGHLTTAYSPAWGPVNKEWIKNHFPITNAGRRHPARGHPAQLSSASL